ncbi:hypothetical protein B0A50_08750 [Salinomyces thailandicus]|uniref:Zinc metalloprotease n=1 Tax=Salinomyces thailandicus TaxID=706561 RepID=A0A4U0TIZ9_9PEZI|nr:hypothetical protein B0A50_08750 [Salinomyces thailandica]
MPATKDQTSNFKEIQRFTLEYAPISITQYESIRTGMRVAVVDQKGPKVNGYFALATEIHDDSGAPHTLEHLCFMGSKAYHYKGLLDKLATRQYSMTNAWTATDQTAYTLDTAGWDAFAQMLPVYLDHLIVPTLTDSGCYTEVHHVDGSGQDAGVVYSEMQGVQNMPEEIIDLTLRRLMYPEGNGFRYETGGMMEQLRVLTADRIRKFHQEMYQPKNMRLVITGEVDHQELLQIVNDFEGSVLNDVPAVDAPFKRPWADSKPTPPLEKTIVKKVQFPEEDESVGEIVVGFFGPRYTEHVATSALSVLIHYLSGSSIAVLENTLVEREQLCSMVATQMDFRSDTIITFGLSAVETDKLEEVEQRFIQLLKDTASKPLDMAYMQDCLKRLRRVLVSRSENAGSFFSEIVIDDHLFGGRDGDDLKTLKDLTDFDELEKWTDQQWRDFMSKWLADAKHVSVLGEPSKALSEKMTAEEKARVKAQQDRLGEAGLKHLAEKLQKAQDENNKPIPDSLLETWPIPSTESIHFISTETARAGAARKLGKLSNAAQSAVDKDDDGSPLFIHFEHIPSNFVRIKLDISTSAVPTELKPLLTLYIMNFFTTPVVRGGTRVDFENVVLDLERETVSYHLDTERGNTEMLSISFETEPERYETVIGWLRTMLFDAVHDPVRLHASLTKILADLPEEKRDGDSMSYAVLAMIQYKQSSSARARSTLSKPLYLKRVKKMLKSEPDTVIDNFTKLCNAMHRPENFRIYVAADLVEKLPKPVTAWRALTDGLDLSKPLEPLPDRKAHLSDVGRNPGNTAYIVPIGAIDSSYGLLSTKGVDSYAHPDLPALMVASTYMDAVEGPLWVAVRGTGLAYGTGWRVNVDAGLITYRIYRSPDAYKAFMASKEQVEGYATGRISLEKLALEGAISEIVLNMANEQPTMATAAEASFLNQVMRGIDRDWNHQMLKKVREVTPEQIRAVMAKYMVPAFKAETGNLIVTCAQIMQEELVAKFGGQGFAPEVRLLEQFQDDYGLKAPEGEEQEADDDEDDEDEDMEDEDDDEGEDEAMDTPGSDDEPA